MPVGISSPNFYRRRDELWSTYKRVVARILHVLHVHRKLRSHQCAAPPANHRSLYGCRFTAIAARVISAIQIDFALGIATPGGLTSGFALPI